MRQGGNRTDPIGNRVAIGPVLPRVSVVVPAFNCASFVAKCLGSLCAQTYPRDHFEIILVDDGSTDGTADHARAIARTWDGVLRVIQKANGGPASARNAGIRASTAEIIAFTDADCIAAPDWLEQVVGILAASDAAGAGGPIANCVPAGWVASYLTSGRFYRHRVRGGEVDYLLTANVAFRRAALLDVNGFSELDGVWAEDADLSFRLRQARYQLLLARQGLVTHYGSPVSVRSLVRELYRYGHGSAIRSRGWMNGRRTPIVELVRHLGAVALAPWLALAPWRAGRVGFWRALSFWPLVVLEHSAFTAGVVRGVVGTGRAGGRRDG